MIVVFVVLCVLAFAMGIFYLVIGPIMIVDGELFAGIGVTIAGALVLAQGVLQIVNFVGVDAIKATFSAACGG